MKKILLTLLFFIFSPLISFASEVSISNLPSIHFYNSPSGNPVIFTNSIAVNNFSGNRNRLVSTDLITGNTLSVVNTSRPSGSVYSTIDLSNGKILVILRQTLSTSSVYSNMVFDSSTGVSTLLFNSVVSNSENYSLSTAVDNNGDFVILGGGISNSTCYNVSSNSNSCDVSNILPSTYFIDIFPDSDIVSNLQYFQGVFYWVNNLGDINYSIYSTSLNIAVTDFLQLSIPLVGQSYFLDVYDYDIGDNKFSGLISISGDDTINFSYDLDDGILLSELISEDRYVIGRTPSGFIFVDSLFVFNSVTVNTKKSSIVPIVDSSGNDAFLYHNGTSWVIDSDLAFDFGFSISSPAPVTPSPVGNSGSGSLGGSISSTLGINCDGTFSFVSPVCWLDSLGEGFSNIGAFSVFTDRLQIYSNFLDFTITPGSYSFNFSLPTSEKNLEIKPYTFTLPESYTPNIIYFSESQESENTFLNNVFLIIGVILYYTGILLFLGTFVFGLGYILYGIINAFVRHLTFGTLGSVFDRDGHSTILGLVFMGIFFTSLVLIFDFLFSPIITPISEFFVVFKETYGHILHFVVSLFTKDSLDLITTINDLNTIISLSIGSLVIFFLFTKYGKLP